jgi:hypothetical protein
MKRANGDKGKRLWTKETANQYIGRVNTHQQVMGLTYWSASDFLAGPKPAKK